MKLQQSRGIWIIAASSLITLALLATPVSANHNHNVIGPVATFVALNLLFNHNHHQHHYNQHRRHYNYGHKRHNYGHKRRHSYSHGGYHRSKRQHYKH